MIYLATREELPAIATKKEAFDTNAVHAMGAKIIWNQLFSNERHLTGSEAVCVGLRAREEGEPFSLDLAFELADGINYLIVTDLLAVVMVAEDEEAKDTISCCKPDEFVKIKQIINAMHDERERLASGKHLRLIPVPMSD